MSPINHFYVFVVNQKEEQEEEVKKVSKQFEIEKIVPALSTHTTMRRLVRKMHFKSCFMAPCSSFVIYEKMLINQAAGRALKGVGIETIHQAKPSDIGKSCCSQ